MRPTIPAGVRESSSAHADGWKGTALSSLRFAIVDDDEELLAVIALLVRSLGHKIIVEARSGHEIVSAIQGGRIHPDVILMDYRMPGMNGIEAAKVIRLADPDSKILIVTADDEVKMEASREGLFYVSKPFSGQDLVNAIENAMRPGQSSGIRLTK